MTLLRRTAQLVEDLRTLNLILSMDIVKFRHCCDESICLEIRFNHPGSSTLISASNIEWAIKQEFDKKFILELKANSSHVLCRILPH